MSQPLPHLQFAVLGILGGDRLSGRDVRERLGDLGVARGLTAFYRLMSRLEESGMVKGRYEQEVIDGQIVRERVYNATAAGRRARDATANFHQRVVAQYSTAKLLG
ncbi:MAG: hypothetical protein GKS06_19960 [Acidobacteria bacterium]|nr:hypothetical protein [Acidobacteriota bacterium]